MGGKGEGPKYKKKGTPGAPRFSSKWKYFATCEYKASKKQLLTRRRNDATKGFKQIFYLVLRRVVASLREHCSWFAR